MLDSQFDLEASYDDWYYIYCDNCSETVAYIPPPPNSDNEYEEFPVLCVECFQNAEAKSHGFAD